MGVCYCTGACRNGVCPVAGGTPYRHVNPYPSAGDSYWPPPPPPVITLEEIRQVVREEIARHDRETLERLDRSDEDNLIKQHIQYLHEEGYGCAADSLD